MTHPDVEKAAKAYNEAWKAAIRRDELASTAHLAGIAAVMKFTLSIEPSGAMIEAGMAEAGVDLASEYRAMQAATRKERGL